MTERPSPELIASDLRRAQEHPRSPNRREQRMAVEIERLTQERDAWYETGRVAEQSAEYWHGRTRAAEARLGDYAALIDNLPVQYDGSHAEAGRHGGHPMNQAHSSMQ